MEQSADVNFNLIEIRAEACVAVPARILDLFSAHGLLPVAFTFNLVADGLRLEVELGEMSAGRRAIVLAKLRRIAGIQWVHAA